MTINPDGRQSVGVTPQAGSGCQPTASAAEEASSQSGIPNAAFVCEDEESGYHDLCPCVTAHAREIMQVWTGTNCTWVDDDITALGILAGHAIRAGLHHHARIPQSLIAAIDEHTASAIEARRAETHSGSVADESAVKGVDTVDTLETPQSSHDTEEPNHDQPRR